MTDIKNNTDLLKVVLKWKKHLLIIGVCAIALSILFSSPMFIRPKFRSYAVIYPSNLIPYGSETPTEQMLQLFQSSEIKNEIIRGFKLPQHYDIDTTRPGYRYYVEKEFDENVEISKTEYEAVRLEVMDTDPLKAYEIAVAMIDQFDKKTRKLHRSKSEEVVLIMGAQLERKSAEIDSLSTALKELKVKYGILDYKAQAKEASKEYYRSLGTNAKKTTDITQSIRNLEEKGNDFIELNERLESSIKVYNAIKVDYDNALRDVEKKLTYTNVVIKPALPDKKVYPVRWIIVVSSTLASLFFAVVLVMIIEGRKAYLKN
ncbi:MAG: hypothetical protein AB1458_03215 [Bacteroidota bacterium]